MCAVQFDITLGFLSVPTVTPQQGLLTALGRMLTIYKTQTDFFSH